MPVERFATPFAFPSNGRAAICRAASEEDAPSAGTTQPGAGIGIAGSGSGIGDRTAELVRIPDPDPGPPNPVSEHQLQTYSRRAWERRMGVNVIDALGGLARQARRVEVIDVGDLGVEKIERLEHEARPARDAIASLGIPQRRALRRDAGILDERARTKMPHAQTAEDRPL